MKRMIRILAALALVLTGVGARAEVIADGTVGYGSAETVLAAMGGAVAEVRVQQGAYVRAEDTLATLRLSRVYAPCAGTVESVFAGEGDSAADATERYGGALTLLPEQLYTVYVTAEDAYSSVRTGLISSGQPVYLKCTRDGSHRGTGIITEIDGEIFRVETTGGAFYNGETVYVYMAPGYAAADRIGKGTIVASDAVGVAAGGDVAKLYVSAGDFVEKGQLLMETLGAMPEDGEAGEYRLTAGVEGYVKAIYAEANADIERGGLLAEICPAEALCVTAWVPEADVTAVRVGDAATVSIELAESVLRTRGRVEAISYLPETGSDGGSGYAIRVSVDADAGIVPGLAASVSVGE